MRIINDVYATEKNRTPGCAPRAHHVPNVSKTIASRSACLGVSHAVFAERSGFRIWGLWTSTWHKARLFPRNSRQHVFEASVARPDGLGAGFGK